MDLGGERESEFGSKPPVGVLTVLKLVESAGLNYHPQAIDKIV